MKKFNSFSNKVVVFDSIFDHQQMSKCFYAFIETEKNTEPYDFILELNKTKGILDEEAKLKKYKELCEIFIKPNSEKELNLSAEIRKNVVNFFNELENNKNEEKLNNNNIKIDNNKENNEKNDKEIKVNNDNKEILEIIEEKNDNKQKIKIIEEFYEKVLFIVRNDILYDTYPRFIRSTKCLELLNKLQNDEKVLIDSIKKQFPYSEEDFKHHVITEKDIQFLKYLSNETYDFKLKKNIKEYQYNIYLSHNLVKVLPNLDFAKYAGFFIIFKKKE
jgi:hypothetical protein